MNFTRILAGASIVGVLGLPFTSLVTGVAAAQPAAPGVSTSGEPLPVDQGSNEPPRDQAPPPAASSGFSLPPDLAAQVNEAAASLPSPVQVNVPVSLGLPGIGLPGLSVPLVLGGLAAAPSLPGIGLPSLPQIGPTLPFGLP